MALSDRSAPVTLGAAERARGGGDRPFLTFRDLVTGERTELGHATFENWTAKTANLFAEDLALAPGSRVTVRVGGHWAGVVSAVAAWRAGLVVDLAAAQPAAVAVVREDLAPPDASETLAVGRGLGARLTGPAAFGEPFADEVLAQADEFTAPPPAADSVALVVTGPQGAAEISHRAMVTAGAQVVEALDLGARGRLLTTLPCDRLDGLVAGPVAALVAAAALVLVPGEPTEATWAHAAAERTTHVLVAERGEPAPSGTPPVRTCSVRVAEGRLAVRVDS